MQADEHISKCCRLKHCVLPMSMSGSTVVQGYSTEYQICFCKRKSMQFICQIHSHGKCPYKISIRLQCNRSQENASQESMTPSLATSPSAQGIPLHNHLDTNHYRVQTTVNRPTCKKNVWLQGQDRASLFCLLTSDNYMIGLVNLSSIYALILQRILHNDR